MTKSILAAALLAAVLAGCAQTAVPPPVAVDLVTSSPAGGFIPYCGPTWSVDRQGYLYIPCPPGSTGYESHMSR